MPKKIAIIGPECSGKSTLTEELAAYFNEPFLPEYGRTFLEIYGADYQYEDLEKITRKMVLLEEEQIKNAKHFLFCDTDLLMMKIWYQIKFDQFSDYLLEAIKKYPYDYYFICKPDLDWKIDPVRENPHIREELFHLYLVEVKKYGIPYSIIEGKNRTADAIKTLKGLFTS